MQRYFLEECQQNMKKSFLIIILLAAGLNGCKKDKNTDPAGDWFLIEVRSPSNLDCKVPEIIFLNRQQEAYQVIGNNSGYYIASGLPKVLYAVGTKMYVTIQKPADGQLLMCTTMGPSFPQVHINAVK